MLKPARLSRLPGGNEECSEVARPEAENAKRDAVQNAAMGVVAADRVDTSGSAPTSCSKSASGGDGRANAEGVKAEVEDGDAAGGESLEIETRKPGDSGTAPGQLAKEAVKEADAAEPS